MFIARSELRADLKKMKTYGKQKPKPFCICLKLLRNKKNTFGSNLWIANHDVFQRLILRAFSCCWLESLRVNEWSNYFSCCYAWPVKKQFMMVFSMSRPFVNGQEVEEVETVEASNGSYPLFVETRSETNTY